MGRLIHVITDHGLSPLAVSIMLVMISALALVYNAFNGTMTMRMINFLISCFLSSGFALANTNCMDGSLRMNASNATSEICHNGNWDKRTLHTYCHPRNSFVINTQEFMTFKISTIRPQGTACDQDQVDSAVKSKLLSDGVIQFTNSTQKCTNNYLCVKSPTLPVNNAVCPATSISWVMDGHECHGNPGSGPSGSVTYAYDSEPPHVGWTSFHCQDGVWTVHPGSCGTSMTNCKTESGLYSDYSYCSGSNKFIQSCCSMVDGRTTCSGESSECP